MSSNFGKIQPLTAELAALERLKNRHKLVSTLSAFIFDWIFFILAGNQDNLLSLDEFEFQPDRTPESGV